MISSNTYQQGVKYPIGEVAKIFGVSVATVRNWEKAGLIVAERTPGNQRRFSIEEIERVKQEAAA